MRHEKLRWLGKLLKEFASLSMVSLARSVRASCWDSFEGLLEEALSSARRTLRLYAVFLGLAVLAALALGTALGEVMTALGLPGWASHLILGSIALGAVALVSSRLETPLREARDNKEGGSTRERHPASLFSITIGLPATRSGRSPQARGTKSRPRRRRVVEVHSHGKSWEVRSRHTPRTKEVFPTEREAVSRALDLARKNSAEVLISGKHSPKSDSFQGVA